MTMGQAVDAAIQKHETSCPGSKVYVVRRVSLDKVARVGVERYLVELDATHFSVPVVIFVTRQMVDKL